MREHETQYKRGVHMFRVTFYNQYGKSYKDFGKYGDARNFIKFIEENSKTISWILDVFD